MVTNELEVIDRTYRKHLKDLIFSVELLLNSIDYEKPVISYIEFAKIHIKAAQETLDKMESKNV